MTVKRNHGISCSRDTWNLYVAYVFILQRHKMYRYVCTVDYIREERKEGKTKQAETRFERSRPLIP